MPADSPFASEVDRIRAFCARWLAAHSGTGAFVRVVRLLAEGELDSQALQGSSNEDSILVEGRRKQALDFVIDYVRYRREDRALIIDDAVDVRLLRLALGVTGNDFLKYRPAEVSAVVQEALDDALTDNRIEELEEVQLAGLQAAFDLSYDDFLRVGRAAFERAISALELGRSLAISNSDPDAERIGRLYNALVPLNELANRQVRSSGALF